MNAEPPESTGILSSPAVGPPGLGCTFSFWYYCKDFHPELSAVAWTVGDVKENLATEHYACSNNQEWRQGKLFIGEQVGPITVSNVSPEGIVSEEFENMEGMIDEENKWNMGGGKCCRRKKRLFPLLFTNYFSEISKSAWPFPSSELDYAMNRIR